MLESLVNRIVGVLERHGCYIDRETGMCSIQTDTYSKTFYFMLPINAYEMKGVMTAFEAVGNQMTDDGYRRALRILTEIQIIIDHSKLKPDNRLKYLSVTPSVRWELQKAIR